MTSVTTSESTFEAPTVPGQSWIRHAVAMLTVLALFFVLTSCSSQSAQAIPVAAGMQPTSDGWSFANFPSSSFPDVVFDESDLVAMFGATSEVCVDGKTDPCVVTAEAAAWGQMINQSRASGHCQGLAIIAADRFNDNSTPKTVELKTEEEALHAVTRAFATQFLPEVQEESTVWLNKSLDEKIDELKKSFATKKAAYTLGLYNATGGHAVTPFAVEYPTKDIARIMVYDSNWPGRNRYVDVDTKKKTWTFSFSAEDPEKDSEPWSGVATDIDLSSVDVSNSTCPFCGSSVQIKQTTLVIRSQNANWNIDTEGGAISPTNPTNESGASVTKVKSAVTRNAFDYVVRIPAPATNSTKTTATKLNFSSSASVFAVLPKGIARLQTGTASSAPVVLQGNAISTTDPSVALTLASGNLVASAQGSSSTLAIGEQSLNVSIALASGEIVQQKVDVATPVLKVVADPQSGGLTVLQAKEGGVVEKVEIAKDGSQTRSVSNESLNLTSVSVELPKALESKPNPVLPALADRDMSNPKYRVDEKYEPPVVVTKSNAVTTTAPPPPTTTVPPTTTLPPRPAPTTTVPVAPTTTVRSAPTTTVPSTTTTVRPAPTTTTTTTIPIASPTIALSSTSMVVTVGETLTSYSVLSTGGPVATYSVSPSLPAGLTFNSSTGRISGTPSAAMTTTTFTITATNTSGSATRTFSLQVKPPFTGYAISAGGVGADRANAMTPLSDGSIIVSGFISQSATFGSATLQPTSVDGNSYLAKVSPTGEWLWAQIVSHGTRTVYGAAGGELAGIQVDAFADDSIIVTGAFNGTVTFGSTTLTNSCSAEHGGFFAAKMDASRNWLWAKQTTGCGFAPTVMGVTVTSTGAVVMSGKWTYNSLAFGATTVARQVGNDGNVNFLAQLTVSGEWGWAKPLAPWCEVNQLESDSSGNFFFYGACTHLGTNLLTDFQWSNNSEAVIAKFNASGAEQWSTVVQAGQYVRGVVRALRVMDDGSLISAGNYTPGMELGGTTTTDAGIFVAKLSSTGQWLWVEKAGGYNYNDGVAAITIRANGTIVLAAYYGYGVTPTYGSFSLGATQNYDREIAIVEISQTGVWLSARQIGTTYWVGWSAIDDPSDIEILPNGTPVLLGMMSSPSLPIGSRTVTSVGGLDIFIATL